MRTAPARTHGLSASWISAAEGLGWALAPLYVGPQAPCVGLAGAVRISAAAAASEGAAAADDAIGEASTLGLPVGSPIYYDMEGYALDSPPCTQAVQTFLSAWVAGLHAQGYTAGVYGSAASTMRDLQALSTTSASPDDVWIADWNGSTSVFGDPYVSDTLWTQHARIHQFSGGHAETYGGVTLTIDGDSVDAAVVAAQTDRARLGTVAARPPDAVADAGRATGGARRRRVGRERRWRRTGQLARGRVQRIGGRVADAGRAERARRRLRHGRLRAAPRRRADGERRLADTLREPADTLVQPPPRQPRPRLLERRDDLAAAGELVGNLLPGAAEAGFAREPDGTLEVVTRTPGLFALLPETTPPPAPAGLRGHFAYGSLVLSWPSVSDASGPAVAYEVSLSGQPLLTVSGETVAALRAFHPHAASVYRVRAIDAAGNLGPPSPPLRVLPSPRPGGIPDPLPAWAWSVFRWQLQGQVGPRPQAPRPLPPWFWRWRAWRIAPFHLG